YIFESFYPDKHFQSFGAREVIDYLRQTNESYVRNQLPNIERHFNALISRSNAANNLSLLFDLYKEVRAAIEQRIEDDTPWFDRVLHQESYIEAGAIHINPDDVNSDNDDAISDTLDDLVNMFVIHLRGDYDANLCHAVLFASISLKKDICQNNRIRNRVLYPLSKAIDKAYNK
ncbi:MAG: helix-turn-helix transcriptional regulator, partial [Candidatus Limisoma sp.]